MSNNKKEKEILKKVVYQNLDLLFDKIEELNKEEIELEREK